MSDCKKKHKLNSKWVLWYHCPDDKNWDIKSYKNIFEFDTVEDFWVLNNNIKSIHIQYGMFFIIREGIEPIWEDSKNRDGGCWSFKLSKKDTFKAWLELSVALIGETIYKNTENIMDINGISISPKKNFSILKIWNSDKKKKNIEELDISIQNLEPNTSIYKSHIV